MTAPSLRLSLAIEETGGAAFFEIVSVPGRVLKTRLRRLPRVHFAEDPTASFVHLAVAVIGMTFVLNRSNRFDYEISHCLQRVRPCLLLNNS
jgi:hypothetical protein